MKKKILLAALLVTFVSTAAAFPSQLQVVERTATSSDPAVFNLTVENDRDDTDRFRISSILSPPVTSDWFEYDYSKEIAGGEIGSFLIEVYPEQNAIQQNYGFTVNLRSLRGGELAKHDSYVSVENEYDLSITSFQLFRTEVLPGDNVNVSATVRNTAFGTLDDFRVELKGFGETQTESGTVLGSSDSIRYNFQLEVPEDGMPGNQTVTLTVFNKGERQQHISQNVSVGEVEEIVRSTEVDDRLLTSTWTTEVENTGNIETVVEVNSSLPVYVDPLVKFDPEPDSVESRADEQFYTWNVKLQPGETDRVGYTIDYVPAVGFLVLLFIGVLGIKKLQTDIRFSKSSKQEEAGIRVRIEIENNSGTPRRNLEVEDFVPDIADVSQEFDFAKPVITHTSNGTRLRWDVDQLDSGEQRVFEYRIKPQVSVEDGVMLPSAEITLDGERVKESDEIEVEFRAE